MTHGSLFSGIGGPDLAAEWMGWKNIFHCEWNPFGQKILKYYWPEAISYEDISKTDFSIHRGQIDILTGGFPCQPYSTAGLRKGKEDERHLWPEMLRAIREVKPRWVVGENVLGLVNWDGGLVFEEVQADLEAQGYEVQPYVLPAAAVGAPHRRDRIWFIAYSGSKRFGEERKCFSRSAERDLRFGDERPTSNASSDRNTRGATTGNWEKENKTLREDIQQQTSGSGVFGVAPNSNQFDGNLSGFSTSKISQFQQAGICCDTTDNDEHSNCERCRQLDSSKLSSQSGFCSWGHTESYGQNATNAACIRLRGKINGGREPGFFSKESTLADWDNFPTRPPVCDGNDGISSRLDGITFSKWRNESIKAGGNAIVPQVIHQIFKAIEEYESL